MRILILGAGAVGGYYGARLIQVGADVTFLVRPEKQRLLKKNGLVIETPEETLTFQPATVTKDCLNSDVDLVVLTPKSYDFAEAVEVVKVIQGKPFLLPFLNGIDHLHQMDRLFGKERVMAGAAYVSTTLTADGSVQQLRDDPSFVFGARHESQKNVAENLHNLCSTSAFESILSLQIEQALWDKWAVLATLAGMTTLMRASMGRVTDCRFGKEATTTMYDECCGVAEKSGYPISVDVKDRALSILSEKGSKLTASMLRDLERNQKTEYEHILGSMVDYAKSVGASCTSLILSYTQMDIRDQERNLKNSELV